MMHGTYNVESGDEVYLGGGGNPGIYDENHTKDKYDYEVTKGRVLSR
jgi:hypothetical protein